MAHGKIRIDALITQGDMNKANPHGFKLSSLQAIAQRKAQHAAITATSGEDAAQAGREEGITLLQDGATWFSSTFCADLLENAKSKRANA